MGAPVSRESQKPFCNPLASTVKAPPATPTHRAIAAPSFVDARVPPASVPQCIALRPHVSVVMFKPAGGVSAQEATA
jgi:hypothetical protein